jgi:hypothetical protein
VCVVETKQQTAPGGQRPAHEFAAMEASLMKVLGVISATALFLLLGATVPVIAQDEHQDQEVKPEKQDQQAKPAKQEDQAKPVKQEEAKPAKQEEQAKPAKQEEQAKSEKQEQQAKPVKQEEQAKPAKPEEQAKQEESGKAAGQQHAQRSAAEEQKQRSAPSLRLSVRSSIRIPDDRFRSSFGEGHTFVINEPVIVGGYSRFQYGGYWFGFVDPWPVGWYYTDYVYVDYIDGGYYLCNPDYPGVRIAISIAG